MCKTGQPHRWQARSSDRTLDSRYPYDAGRATCPCNNLAHNHPGVAAEWDWEVTGERTQETVTASNNVQAAWRCGLCGHRWTARVQTRTYGEGWPQCAREARRHGTKQPSISVGAPHLLAEWDWEANETHFCCPDQPTLGSSKRVHWVVQDECKLGLVHSWQASPGHCMSMNSGSPFPSGKAVCACNSLAVQCPGAADLWNSALNGSLNPHRVTWQSNQEVRWKAPDGRQWHQKVFEVVGFVRRHQAKSIE